MGQRNVFKKGTDNRVISWVKGAKRDGKVSRDYIEWEMVTVPGLKGKGNVIVYQCPETSLSCYGVWQKLWTGEMQLQPEKQLQLHWDTEAESEDRYPDLLSLCQCAFCKLDKKPSWKRRLDAIEGDQPPGAESKTEKSTQGQKITEWIGRKNHLWYLNYFLSVFLSISVSIFQKFLSAHGTELG